MQALSSANAIQIDDLVSTTSIICYVAYSRCLSSLHVVAKSKHSPLNDIFLQVERNFSIKKQIGTSASKQTEDKTKNKLI